MAVRGRNMGLHADPGNSTHLARLATAEVGWLRTWAWAEYPWLCSTPDSTSSRGTLSTATVASELHGVFTGTSLQVIYPFLGVPRSVNPRGGTGAGAAGDGSYHRFATTSAGRAQTAADAATIAQALFAGYEDRGIFEVWNEPNILAFSRDQGYLGGAESTAAVYAAMLADIVDAVRAALPTLPIMLGSPAARGDMNSRGTGEAATYLGDTYSIAILDWLLAHRPGSMPDLFGFHPYIYTQGWLASLDSNGVLSSSPYTSKGWNGVLQQDAIATYMQGAGFANRDALLGTGTGAARCSRKPLPTEYGGPSRDPLHDVDPDQRFDEQWQAQHDREHLEVFAYRQAIGACHPVAVRYTSVDTAAPTASSATADYHDYMGLFRQDGSHKPALDAWLVWARKPLDDGSNPNAPVVVPKEPPSPAVQGEFLGAPTLYTITATGQLPLERSDFTQERAFTRDEQHPQRNLCRGVLVLGGLGGYLPGGITAAGLLSGSRQVWRAIAHALTRRPGQPNGYTFLGLAAQTGVAPAGWGNDSSMAVLDQAIDYLQGNGLLGGANGGKVALVGESMGHCTAFNYALRNPDKVAGVLGLNGVCSLEYHWNGGVDNILIPPGHGGCPSAIAQAYGLGTPVVGSSLDATVKAQRDPLTRAHEMAGFPWGFSYGLGDTVVGRETVDAFIAAKGGVDEFSLIRQTDNPPGEGSHSTMFLEEWELYAWLETCAW